ncbi:hypothetical protein DUNSADRAFT_14600 [Dunaliella salina]|uniref:Secreted protein n=1 Tax=Dunaliella salina TaxID=3046 RepID=A0ABQ7H2F8_DUNSA|nr:hypothetical protein DUNSADRAFT_14600 [Dunaliella salina]|eukprot:KAF5841042.1 hypothetical protein DUNSADRAFT_14600 [Dunaliella salina]
MGLLMCCVPTCARTSANVHNEGAARPLLWWISARAWSAPASVCGEPGMLEQHLCVVIVGLQACGLFFGVCSSKRSDAGVHCPEGFISNISMSSRCCAVTEGCSAQDGG